MTQSRLHSLIEATKSYPLPRCDGCGRLLHAGPCEKVGAGRTALEPHNVKLTGLAPEKGHNAKT